MWDGSPPRMKNCLEASPGIEPGCKDLQSRPTAFSNPLISGVRPRNRGKTLENQRQVLAGLGVSRHHAAMMATRRADESLTRNRPSGRRDVKSFDGDKARRARGQERPGACDGQRALLGRRGHRIRRVAEVASRLNAPRSPKGASDSHGVQHLKAIACHPRDAMACGTVECDNLAPRRTAKSTLVFTLLRSPAKIAPAYLRSWPPPPPV